MFMIKDNNIYMNRGDALHIYLKLRNKTFEPNDTITINIVKENDYSSVVFTKTVTIEEESSTFNLSLTGSETKLGEVIKSEPRTYWYEIQLNNDTTLVGYDHNGPKKLILFPEAVGGNNNEQQSSI